jgi:hypothetical protein
MQIREADMKYAYTFGIWPAGTWGFRRSLFDVMRLLNSRVEMHFTEAEFERFRSELNHDGFTMRGITRIPYHDPEGVL